MTLPEPFAAEDAASRRIASEIEVFARQGRLHGGNSSMNWRNARVVIPMLRAGLGHTGVHEFYATRIAAARERTGADTALSIGCGSGHEEIETLRCADRLGLSPFAIIGLELSPVAAERANRLAEQEGLAGRFRVIVQDLNAGLPELPPVAAIMAHHVLHHVVALEAMYAGIAALLHPQGSLLTFDMIGRNGHQRWPEVGPLVRAIWRAVPAAQRRDHLHGRPLPHWQDWDCAIEGFEGVRAQEVLPLLARHFVPERFICWGGLIDAFVNDRTGPCFEPEERPADRVFLERLATLEAELLARRATTPTEMGGEFRRADSGFVPLPEVAARFARALRDTDDTFPVLPVSIFDSPWPPQEDLPEVLPPGTLDAATLAAHGALEDGWDTELGRAILTEQGLHLRFPEPVAAIEIDFWHFQPDRRPQLVSIALNGQIVLKEIPMPRETLVPLRVEHPAGPTAEWRLRVHCTAYRLPDEDGGKDLRPVAWILGQVRPDPHGAGAPAAPVPAGQPFPPRQPPPAFAIPSAATAWSRLREMLRRATGG